MTNLILSTLIIPIIALGKRKENILEETILQPIWFVMIKFTRSVQFHMMNFRNLSKNNDKIKRLCVQDSCQCLMQKDLKLHLYFRPFKDDKCIHIWRNKSCSQTNLTKCINSSQSTLQNLEQLLQKKTNENWFSNPKTNSFYDYQQFWVQKSQF